MNVRILFSCGLMLLVGGCAAKPESPAHSAAVLNPDSGPYRHVKEFAPGGEGGWGRITVDTQANPPRLYIARDSYVLVVNSKTGARVGEVTGCSMAHTARAVPAVGKGFASNGGAGTCSVFDLRTLKTIATVKTGKNPDSVAYEPVNRRVFVCNASNKSITVINADDLSVAGTIEIGGLPERAIVDGKGKLFVTVFELSEILRIDGKSMQIEHRYPVAPGEEPTGIVLDPARGVLIAVCVNEQMVVLDAQTGKVLSSQPVGSRVDDIVIDPDGLVLHAEGHGMMQVYAPPEGEGARGKPYRHIQDIPTAVWARSLAQDPVTRRVYLPYAQYRVVAGGQQELKPGSFRVVVVEPAKK